MGIRSPEPGSSIEHRARCCEKAGTRPGKKKGDDEIDVFILAADYEFHSEQDVDLSGIFSQAVSS